MNQTLPTTITSDEPQDSSLAVINPIQLLNFDSRACVRQFLFDGLRLFL